MPFAAVGISGDADPRSTGTHTHPDADAAAAAAVFTRRLLGILRGNQVHVPGRIKRYILTGLDLAARHGDVAPGGLYRDVAARVQAAALCGLTRRMR